MGNICNPLDEAAGHKRRRSSVSFNKEFLASFHPTGKVLGTGSFSEVTEVFSKKTKQQLAVKSIEKVRLKRLSRLTTEVRALQRLSHPNIIRLQAVFEDERYAHLVTQVCRGGTLIDHIIFKAESHSKVHTEAEASKIMKSVLEAISHCHEHNIVHRDIKAENVLVRARGRGAPEGAELLLADFGLCAVLEGPGRRMTTRVGTPYCLAPELLRKGAYGPGVDVWGAGVLLYLLLAGTVPFKGRSDRELLLRIRAPGPVPFPRARWGRASAPARHFAQLLLTKDPRARPTAAEALRHPFLLRHRRPLAPLVRAAAPAPAPAPAPACRAPAPASRTPAPVPAPPGGSGGPLPASDCRPAHRRRGTDPDPLASGGGPAYYATPEGGGDPGCLPWRPPPAAPFSEPPLKVPPPGKPGSGGGALLVRRPGGVQA